MVIPEFLVKSFKNRIWTRGDKWEFDWYIDVIFIEVMAYGKNPVFIGYLQPVIGDEFLKYSKDKEILKKFLHFFRDIRKVNDLLQRQNEIITKGNKFLKKIKRDSDIDLHKYKNVQKELSLLMASVSVVFDKIIEKEIQRISKSNKVSTEELISYVIQNSSVTELNKSNKQLLRIFRENKIKILEAGFSFNKLSHKTQSLLNKHAQKYGWINTGEKGSKEWTGKNFLKQLKELSNTKANYNEAKSTLKTLKDKDNLLIEKIITLNINDNQAADLQVELDFLFQKYLKNKLGKQYQESIIENLTFEEILDIVSTPKKISKYTERNGNNYRIVWPEKRTIKFLYFNTKKEFEKVIKLIQFDINYQNEIRGAVACSGYVEGVVRIIKSPNDLKKFKTGEILVSTHTQPRYTIIMMKAKGIVTDIGGITSHAAIISREFKIPCIVGTGNATKILKNGDRVIVNAHKGFVKKID
jgi:phosphoenolpyruvate synthase/pyruvate phosphate dikinase